jgi:hypothetical protein
MPEAVNLHRERWWYSPPWKVTRPWQSRVRLFPEGGDEYCNPTIMIVFPLLGDVTIRYQPGPIRTRACDTCVEDWGPWCTGCETCHPGPRCHDWGHCRHNAPLKDCPVCKGTYCTLCEPEPQDNCPAWQPGDTAFMLDPMYDPNACQ